jgi:hypothetical protein
VGKYPGHHLVQTCRLTCGQPKAWDHRVEEAEVLQVIQANSPLGWRV